MRFEEIEKLSHEGFQLGLLCKLAGVSPSGFYSWKGRPESKRQLEDGVLKERISVFFKESRKTYGVPRLRNELKKEGMLVSKSRVQGAWNHGQA